MLDLPYLKSLGIDGRAQGPKEIEGFIASLLAKVPDFAFKNVRFLMETPEQVFAEYEVEALVPSTGKIYRQMYAGRLVARDGKISLLREALDTMAAAHAFSMGQLI
ncbi:nuclear transport factor 2 family protein [Paraburkholderia sp. LEh10]|uniref:nuclear transport factor 2 family protein n=1 Tax=Paraburkholderia sp. LEh10 TaxID=2821353 RepID=UPI0028A723E5|nr:nuclear transport factor 2 family protein [Paraburkholderia sp. LEh10]